MKNQAQRFPEELREGGKETGAAHSADAAYASALEAIERLFLDQRARILAETQAALAAARRNDIADDRVITRAAARAARISWEADEQVDSLKRRLDDLCRERVVEPIMEIRKISAEMEKRNRKVFRRRIGDV